MWEESSVFPEKGALQISHDQELINDLGGGVKVVLARFGGDTKSAGIVQCDPGKGSRWFLWLSQEQQVEVRAKKCRMICLGISIFNSILYLI